MGILSGPEIIRQVQLGKIIIDPFDPQRVGPNSVDVHLGPILLEIEDPILDLLRPPTHVKKHTIGPGGFLLHPGRGYLGHTIERMRCDGFVPWLDGRSSVGRYFIQCHQTAGRGDYGWVGRWTLEMVASSTHAVRIYAGLPLAQVSFFTVEGDRQPYRGRYQDQDGPTLPKPFPRPEGPAWLT